ncbi:hypothetical protein EDD86DRAFT_220228 [Gorgonomyces haynaldii]|nr:hypothetical protein EDD86DRAFT_220228 [Gorgonomyces haynaldii]
MLSSESDSYFEVESSLDESEACQCMWCNQVFENTVLLELHLDHTSTIGCRSCECHFESFAERRQQHSLNDEYYCVRCNMHCSPEAFTCECFETMGLCDCCSCPMDQCPDCEQESCMCTPCDCELECSHCDGVHRLQDECPGQSEEDSVDESYWCPDCEEYHRYESMHQIDHLEMIHGLLQEWRESRLTYKESQEVQLDGTSDCSSEEEHESQCVICLEKPRSRLFLPCRVNPLMIASGLLQVMFTKGVQIARRTVPCLSKSIPSDARTLIQSVKCISESSSL